MSEIPFSRPTLRGDEGDAVARVIATGWVSQGPRVREFETRFAERVGAAEAVAVSNCTTALQLALHVAGVGPGDEVIVPSMSFIATANSVWQCGATPVFADVDPRNAASLALLTRHGFIETGRAAGTWQVGDELCDSIYLALDL